MPKRRSQGNQPSGGSGGSGPMSLDSPPDDPNLYLSPYNSSGMNDPNFTTPGSSKKSSDAMSTVSEDRLNDVRTYFANTGLR